ncbi:arsenate reductase family protein [Marimonas lutisalis]|uniref:arsenate reductase family protein n=1 Tax=Marimonas lutisalis TaxID=2545756 RepID=UPI0010FA10FD|nr:ArsC/Spx/MgsR family protein [Marimonas lutisalis]
MKIYGLKNCDTCRKALKSLGDAELIDVRERAVPAEVMEKALADFGENLLNRRSTTWRNLSEDDRQGTVAELIAAHPALMKRPLIEAGGQLYLGWDKAVQAALLG